MKAVFLKVFFVQSRQITYDECDVSKRPSGEVSTSHAFSRSKVQDEGEVIRAAGKKRIMCSYWGELLPRQGVRRSEGPDVYPLLHIGVIPDNFSYGHAVGD